MIPVSPQAVSTPAPAFVPPVSRPPPTGPPPVAPPPIAPPPTDVAGPTPAIAGGQAKRYPVPQQPVRPTAAPGQQGVAQQPLYTPAGQPITSGMAQMSMNDSSRQSSAVPRPDGKAAQQSAMTVQQMFAHLPPSAQCSKAFMRMTCNAIPNNASLVSKWNLPLGCLVRPLAPLPQGHPGIPILDSPGALIRCMDCRAYINPFVSFAEGGRRWVCNLCHTANEVPPAYHHTVDMRAVLSGDVSSRPELSCASVEFVATKDYMFRAPQPPVYLFVIDVTQPAVASGSVAVIAAAIKQSLDQLAKEERTMVGFITFDQALHFYNLKSTLSQPQMLVVTDVNDVFLPMPSDLLVNLTDSRKLIEQLLDKLPTMFEQTLNIDTAYGAAVDAAARALKHFGGKVLTFLSSLPTVGPGKLTQREDRKVLGTEKERPLLQPADDFYKNAAVAASGAQICFDSFFLCEGYVDIATVGSLSHFTAGQVFYYPKFHVVQHGEKLGADIMETLLREQGFEAVLRVRCSKGLRVENYYGHYFRRSSDLLTLANVDSGKCYGIELRLDDSVINTNVMFLQTALLYTVPGGVRRIRTHTIAVPVTTNLADLYRYADVEATLNLNSKIGVEKALAGGTQTAREWLVKRCVETLRIYRSFVSSQAKTSQQLVLPETLKLLPIFTLALIKHRGFRAGISVTTDERSYVLRTMSILSTEHLVPFVYPRLFQAWPYPDESELTELPPSLNLSMERLQQQGAFLLTDTTCMYLWVARDVSPTFLECVFGVRLFEELTPQTAFVRPLPNPVSERLMTLIGMVRQMSSEFMPIVVCKQGELLEQRVFGFLVEDKSQAMMSYSDFLAYLHKQIQQ